MRTSGQRLQAKSRGPQLCKGILDDLRARSVWYRHDWKDGFNCGIRILAPSTYIFFASAIPALAFGEQLATYTGGILTGVHVLLATAICGVLQAVLGGQPLLIVGVAEPIVLVYHYMFDFAEKQPGLGAAKYLAWAAWVCVFAGIMILALAAVNSCRFINKFTRFSGELFGMLIAVLFLQQTIKGLKEEFQRRPGISPAESTTADQYEWRLVNGLFGIILACGLLYFSLLVRRSRSFRFGRSWARSFLADYGVPLMVVVWSGISYSLKGTPGGIPRRLLIPNTWSATQNYSVIKDMGSVGGEYIAAALVPAAIITVLFYFDHNVSSQLAQQEDFNLRKPPAYHYDFALLGFMTIGCGLLGIPPVNGVLPQAPMHTKSLATLKQQIVRGALHKTAKGQGASASRSDLMSALEDASRKVGSAAAERISKVAAATATAKAAQNGGSNVQNGGSASQNGITIVQNGGSTAPNGGHGQGARLDVDVEAMGGEQPGGVVESATNFDLEKEIDAFIPVEVKEQRVSGLLQSLLVGACLGITPALQRIPTAVLWGYFAYMALDSLPGSQFWDRLLLLATDPARRFRALETAHVPYLETVRFRVIAAFTLLQLVFLLAVYGLTWAGIAGVAFPILIMALIPLRKYALPRIFRAEDLQELDASEYEVAPPASHEQALQEARELGMVPPEGPRESPREILDEETTGRGQIKHHVSASELERRASASRGAASLELQRRSHQTAPPLHRQAGGGEGSGSGTAEDRAVNNV